MKEIINNELAFVSYDDVSKAIITVWKRPSTEEAYCEILSLVLDKIIEYKSTALITDIYQQGIVGIEIRCWIQDEILPKAYGAGLKKIAFVSPNDIFSKFYIDSIKTGALSKSINFEYGCFQNLISAQAWLLNEEMVGYDHETA
jgi:hypothetical protein